MISMVFALALTGCTEKDQSVDKQGSGGDLSNNRRVLDFERPEERPNISGLVKGVVGNEVTILKIERPTNEDGEDVYARTEEEREERRATGGTHIPGMGGGMGGGMRPSSGTTNTDARIEMMKKMSTGEEKVIVPVGIRMLKNVDGEMVEATLADVKADTMLTIWTDTTITDRNLANFVIIR